MSEEQAPQSTGDADKPNGNPPSVEEQIADVKTEQEKADTQKSPSANEQKPTESVKVNVVHRPKVNFSAAFWSNVIQLGMVAVTAAMLYFTYMLFSQTKESVAISQAALNASTDAIKEAQKQFEIDKMPYLQAGNFQYVNDSTLNYSIFNLNQYPAKIVSIQMAPGHMASMNPLSLQTQISGDSLGRNIIFKPLIDPLTLNVYVIKDSPVETFYRGHIPINRYGSRIYGRIWYMNEVTKQKRQYNFSIYLSGNKKKLTPEFHNNENFDFEGEFPQIMYK